MLSQLFEMENVFTVSSDPHPPPATPPSLSLPLSSSSTSSGTKKQKRTPTYQRSVSQGSSHPSLFFFVLRAWLRRVTWFDWNTLQTCFLTFLSISFTESWKIKFDSYRVLLLKRVSKNQKPWYHLGSLLEVENLKLLSPLKQIVCFNQITR